jgi:hypothetical protein
MSGDGGDLLATLKSLPNRFLIDRIVSATHPTRKPVISRQPGNGILRNPEMHDDRTDRLSAVKAFSQLLYLGGVKGTHVFWFYLCLHASRFEIFPDGFWT